MRSNNGPDCWCGCGDWPGLSPACRYWGIVCEVCGRQDGSHAASLHYLSARARQRRGNHAAEACGGIEYLIIEALPEQPPA